MKTYPEYKSKYRIKRRFSQRLSSPMQPMKKGVAIRYQTSACIPALLSSRFSSVKVIEWQRKHMKIDQFPLNNRRHKIYASFYVAFRMNYWCVPRNSWTFCRTKRNKKVTNISFSIEKHVYRTDVSTVQWLLFFISQLRVERVSDIAVVLKSSSAIHTLIASFIAEAVSI